MVRPRAAGAQGEKPVSAAARQAPIWAAVLLVAIGLGTAFFSIAAAISIGSVQIPIDSVWAIIFNRFFPGVIEPTWPMARDTIVFELRFPRALLGVLVGAGLGVVGAAMQSALRNPLADPHLLGVSAGASLGANLALLHTGMILGLFTLPIFAFGGALFATLLVIAISSFSHAVTADRLVLSGIAISFIITSLANILILLGDPRAAHTVLFWSMGGLGLGSWSNLAYPLVATLLAGTYLLWRAPELNALAMGDETAATLGISVVRFRLSVLVVGAFLTGTLVAFSGMIGFVGLMMPHIARLFVGGDNRFVTPVSALLGSIFLLWADIAARTIIAPEEMPIGIVTGLVGGAFFVILLRRRRENQG